MGPHVEDGRQPTADGGLRSVVSPLQVPFADNVVMVEDAPDCVAGDLHRYPFGILRSDRIADRGAMKAIRNSTIEIDYSASPVPCRVDQAGSNMAPTLVWRSCTKIRCVAKDRFIV